MSNKKNSIFSSILIILVIVTSISLILFSPQISVGIIDSINRCLTVIIPSLFCFLVLSSFLIRTNLYILISKPFDLISRYVFRIRGELFSVFLISLFAGYPAGAKLLAELKFKDMITEKEAEKMLCFCYTAGPSFIIGLVGVQLFNNIKIGLLIYLSLVITNLILAFIIGLFSPIPQKSQNSRYISITANSQTIVESVQSGAKSLFVICSMIVFFSSVCVLFKEFGIINLLSEFFNKLLGWNSSLSETMVNSLLEISFLGGLSKNPYPYLPLITSIFSFGGVCIILQVVSIVNGAFKTKKFIITRLLSMPISYLISIFVMKSISSNVSINIISVISYKLVSNISPIPSIFLLIMTILLLSEKKVAKL